MYRSHLFLLLLFFQITSAYAGQNDVLQIKDLASGGQLLQQGWKYQVGDDPAYASPDFDDGSWQSFDPTIDIYKALNEIPGEGIGWLRIRLRIDSAIQFPLALSISQAVASEIYLNGRRIAQYGKIDSIPSEVRVYNPFLYPLVITSPPGMDLVLAIRFALNPSVRYGTYWGKVNPLLSITLTDPDHAIERYRNRSNDGANSIRIGVYFLLSILFLGLYFMYPKNGLNLKFGLFAFLALLAWIPFIFPEYNGLLHRLFVLDSFMLTSQVASGIFLLTAIYQLLGFSRSYLFYVVIAIGIASVPLAIFFYGWGWLVYGLLFTNLVNFEITRVTILSIQKSKPGVWIIGLGCISFFVNWIIFSLGFAGYLSSRFDFFSIAWLSIPIAVSFYLAYDFARTNELLQQRVREVKKLSREKNQILTRQKENLEQEVANRTQELQESLQNLKSTQAQLIQSEKMASLGELTAGIAHEIQNPLNFVNNFSEVSAELVGEIEEERGKSQSERDEVLIGEILGDVRENLSKINHHGKRADAIVKGMLEHSRKSAGEKVLTDINALAEEYLRLSYHGMKAKDKSFTCDYQTDLEPNLPKVNVIPQDIGRVLLNIINNAFQAVGEFPSGSQPSGDFKPLVTLSTRSLAGKIEILIKDNGPGIPDSIKDKIFQPFFTTKPTGQGTGLGLSLSYDIVKAHGGEIEVDSVNGMGSSFRIYLKVSNDRL